MKTSIVVKLQVEGVHRWSACDMEQVAYLRNPHRHLFAIEATKEVTHNNRQIEIITLKHSLQDYLSAKYGTPCDFGEMSCEMISVDLLEAFRLDSCRVLEDNENGAETRK